MSASDMLCGVATIIGLVVMAALAMATADALVGKSSLRKPSQTPATPPLTPLDVPEHHVFVSADKIEVRFVTPGSHPTSLVWRREPLATIVHARFYNRGCSIMQGSPATVAVARPAAVPPPYVQPTVNANGNLAGPLVVAL